MKIIKTLNYDVELTPTEESAIVTVEELIFKYCGEIRNEDCDACPFSSYCSTAETLKDIFSSFSKEI